MPLDQAGIKECGWLSKWAFQIGALAADSFGRQAIEDAFFAATAEMRAKFADAFINAAKLAADAVETAKILDANGTTAKIALAAITLARLESAKLLYTGVYDYAEYGRSVYA